MLCDQCGEREATIHEVVIRNNQQMERHLCERCAQGAGVSGGPQPPIHEMLSQYVIAKSGRPSSSRPELSCDTCGLEYGEFKKTGLLGCPTCYDSFGERLGPLVEQAHEGGLHHVGKLPKRALEQTRQRGGSAATELVGDIEERAKRRAILQEQLTRAVEAEQFERAARLRDEIRQLGRIDEDDGGGGGGGQR
ncbi:MAG: UvrB/UvrC motif-containing protein [Planctomycetota bacterium]